MGTNTYLTAELDLDIKYGGGVDLSITVLNADTTAYDFSNKTDSNLYIYDRIGGTVQKTIPEDATSGLSYASNVVTWKDPWADVQLAPGCYYYVIIYNDSATSNPLIPVVDGILTVEEMLTATATSSVLLATTTESQATAEISGSLLAYYFSNSGDAGNTGLTALDPLPPSYIQTNITSGNGEILYLNKGETFDISLTVSRAVIIGAYGTGAAPIIRGSDAAAGTWTDEGSGVFSIPLVGEPEWVWIDGVLGKMSQTAFIDVSDKPADNQLQVLSGDVSGYATIVGSKVLHKEAGFRYDNINSVASNVSGLITCDNDINSGGANYDVRFLNRQEFFTPIPVDYTSDFTVGTDGFAEVGTGLKFFDRISAVGRNDILKASAQNNTGTHSFEKTAIFSLGLTFSISFDFYIPSANTNVDGFSCSLGGGGVAIASELSPTLDQWNTISTSVLITGNDDMKFFLLSGGSGSFTGAGSNSDDILYIDNISIQVTSVAAEWAWESDVLYLNAGSEPTDVRIPRTDKVIEVTTGAVTTIQDIHIKDGALYGIYTDQNNLTVSGCTISEQRGQGITAVGEALTNILITGNTISEVALNGIYITGTTSPIITLNTISEIGTQDNAGWANDPGNAGRSLSYGIRVHTSGTAVSQSPTVSYNDISQTWSCGIGCSGAKNANIHHNHISYSQTGGTDGGGIYFNIFTGSIDLLGYPSGRIHHNYIHDIYGSDEGTDGSLLNNVGIYTDSNCDAVEVDNNFIEEIGNSTIPGWGFLRNLDSNAGSWHDNTVVGAITGGIRIIRTDKATDNTMLYLENIDKTFENNIIVNREAGAYFYLIHAHSINDSGFADPNEDYDPFIGTGNCDNNYLISPYDALCMYDETDDVAYNFASWQSTYGRDASSTNKNNWLSYTDEATAKTEVLTVVNWTSEATTYDVGAGYEDIDGVDVSSTTINIPAYSGVVLLQT